MTEIKCCGPCDKNDVLGHVEGHTRESALDGYLCGDCGEALKHARAHHDLPIGKIPDKSHLERTCCG